MYLEYFGIICIAWQWLLQGVSIHKALAGKVKKKDERFYRGKVATLQYFFEYELPKTLGLEARLRKNDGLTVSLTAEMFND